MQSRMTAVARSVGEVVSGIGVGLSRLLVRGVEAGRNETRKVTDGIRLKLKTPDVEFRLEELFASLGEEYYRRGGKNKDFLVEECVQDLIKRIRECRGELERIREGYNSQ